MALPAHGTQPHGSVIQVKSEDSSLLRYLHSRLCLKEPTYFQSLCSGLPTGAGERSTSALFNAWTFGAYEPDAPWQKKSAWKEGGDPSWDPDADATPLNQPTSASDHGGRTGEQTAVQENVGPPASYLGNVTKVGVAKGGDGYVMIRADSLGKGQVHVPASVFDLPSAELFATWIRDKDTLALKNWENFMRPLWILDHEYDDKIGSKVLSARFAPWDLVNQIRQIQFMCRKPLPLQLLPGMMRQTLIRLSLVSTLPEFQDLKFLISQRLIFCQSCSRTPLRPSWAVLKDFRSFTEKCLTLVGTSMSSFRIRLTRLRLWLKSFNKVTKVPVLFGSGP